MAAPASSARDPASATMATDFRDIRSQYLSAPRIRRSRVFSLLWERYGQLCGFVKLYGAVLRASLTSLGVLLWPQGNVFRHQTNNVFVLSGGRGRTRTCDLLRVNYQGSLIG